MLAGFTGFLNIKCTYGLLLENVRDTYLTILIQPCPIPEISQGKDRSVALPVSREICFDNLSASPGVSPV